VIETQDGGILGVRESEREGKLVEEEGEKWDK